MARSLNINRNEAELLVTLLEENYRHSWVETDAGMGADLAAEIRKLFGMAKQPQLDKVRLPS